MQARVLHVYDPIFRDSGAFIQGSLEPQVPAQGGIRDFNARVRVQEPDGDQAVVILNGEPVDGVEVDWRGLQGVHGLKCVYREKTPLSVNPTVTTTVVRVAPQRWKALPRNARSNAVPSLDG